MSAVAILVGACLIWIGASGAAWIITRRMKRARLQREAEAKNTTD